MTAKKSKRYPASVKAAAVRRYLTTRATYVEVAEEFGCSKWSVNSWVVAAQQARADSEVDPLQRRPDDRTPKEKVRLMLEAAALIEADRGAFLRKHGLHDADLERWQTDAVGAMERDVASGPQSRRVRELERKNRKQGKRLREAEALLELQKKVTALWGDADDDTTSD